jgi:hypothetical protein
VNGRTAALALAATLAVGAPARAQQATVRVHVEGDPRAVLQLRWPGERHWEDVCQAPCDLRVPIDATYRVNGDGIQQSRRFRLPSTYGEARVDVAPASSDTHVFGIVAMGLGGASFVAGLMTMLVAVLTETCSDCIGGFASTTAPNIAWALMGGGAVSIVAGAVIFAETKTQVGVTTADAIHAPQAPMVLPERGAVALPPVAGVPVVGFRF